MGGVGRYGYSWASTVSGTNAYYLDFSSGSINPGYGATRANGFQVRCLRE